MNLHPCFMDVITISITLVMLADTVHGILHTIFIEYDFAVQEQSALHSRF